MRISWLPLALFLVVPWLPSSAVAIEFDVTTTDDAPDAVIDGVCADATGACTLRAAVQEANASTDPAGDVIRVPAGKYVLTEQGPDEDEAETGDLDLTRDVTIVGAGMAATIVQGKKDRVFEVPFAATAVITDLAITKGSIGTKKRVKADESFNGGGLASEGTVTLERVIVSRNKSADDGGGLSNVFGTMVLRDVLVEANKAKDDAGGLEHDGGTVMLERVTFVKNKAKDEAGAMEVEQGTLSATNATFSQNKARFGGAINAEQDGVVELSSATFFKNKAKEPSGAIQNEDDGATVELTNVLFDGHKKGACTGTIVSNGGNLETGATCQLGAGDLSDVGNGGLEKLDENGGATPTHALAPDSPALDAGTQDGCPAEDQRGEGRDDGACDVGAFEL